MDANESRFVLKTVNREIIVRVLNPESKKKHSTNEKIPAWIDTIVIEQGYKIWDDLYHRLEYAFYYSTEQAEKYLNRLNSTRLPKFTEKKDGYSQNS